MGSQIDIVFQSYSPPPRKIDPWLDGDYRVSGKGCIGSRRHPWRLVHFQPQPMPQRMAESVAKTAGGGKTRWTW